MCFQEACEWALAGVFNLLNTRTGCLWGFLAVRRYVDNGCGKKGPEAPLSTSVQNFKQSGPDAS